MRTELRNELSPVIARAVGLGKEPGAPAAGVARAGARAASSPGDEVTEQGVDDDGTVYTIWDFCLGVDELGGKNAALRVQGNAIDYGN